eukprot:scaffold956_cov533-Prasinococcus_capsulatus_cf.AAC.2
MIVSVAPTLGLPPAPDRKYTLPSFISTSAPIACKPRICRSTGRAPILQPPGSGKQASPSLASRGPATRKLARSLRTAVTDGVHEVRVCVFKTTFSGLPSTPNSQAHPTDASTSDIDVRSTSCGTRRSSISPLEQSRVAAKRARAEFFAPLMRTCPSNLAMPATSRHSSAVVLPASDAAPRKEPAGEELLADEAPTDARTTKARFVRLDEMGGARGAGCVHRTARSARRTRPASRPQPAAVAAPACIDEGAAFMADGLSRRLH